jgi:IS5 family transposase
MALRHEAAHRTDSQTGLVHSASVTAANVHDSHQVPNLLHGEETRFYGDSAYRGKEQRERLKAIAPKAKDFTNKRAYRNNPLSDADKETNRRKSSVRSKVEHPFLTLKRLWGFAKVRYRGLAKNANRAFAMLAMLNVSQMGTTADGRGASGMSKIQGNSPVSALERTDYPMKTAFPSRFRLDFSSSSLFAVACSAFP